jgi:hypothetical protein
LSRSTTFNSRHRVDSWRRRGGRDATTAVTTRAAAGGDDGKVGGPYPGLAGGIKNVLDFFRTRVDRMLEDGDEVGLCKLKPVDDP